jgi:DNA-binding transcriptional LysR family regulator
MSHSNRFIAEVRSERISLLKSGVADLAVLLPYEVTNELDSKMIAPNELVMVGPVQWKGRAFKTLLHEERMVAYTPEDPLGADYLREFHLLDELKRPRLFANENESMLALILMGAGFGLLPEDLVRPYIKQKKLIALNAYPVVSG